MNLIEMLGGYEAAKLEFEKIKIKPLYPNEVETNERLLLEYRRAHNIFEVGDYAVDEQHTGLLRVTRVMKKRLDVDYLNPQTLDFICHHSILIRHIRHATDEEIKAGHRL